MQDNHSPRLKWRLIGEVFKEKAGWVALMFASLICTGLFRALGADYVKQITAHIQNRGITGLSGLILLVCVIQFVNYSTKFVSAFSCTKLNTELTLKARMKLLDRIQHMPLSIFEEQKAGDLQSVIYNDAPKAASFVYMFFSRIGVSAFTALFTLYFMFAINLEMTVITLAVALGFGGLNQHILGSIRSGEKESRETLGEMTGVAVNACESFDTVKVYHAQQYVKGRFWKSRALYNEALLGVARTDACRVGFYTIVNNVVLFGGALYMAWLAVEGRQSLGDVLAYVTLSTQAMVSVEMIFRWSSKVAASSAAWDRVQEILSIPAETALQKDGLMAISSLDFQNIFYQYEPGRTIIDNKSFRFEKGTLTGIAGESGSGKSTLLKCLMGLYHSGTMTVMADGDGLEPDVLTSAMAYVPSENILFSGSIRDNLTLGEERISDKDCMAWAEQLGIKEWIESLSGGLSYRLEEGGRNLSGGQRQTLCILRAVLTNRPVLILDEPFSALDGDRIEQFTAMLKLLKKTRIVILTSHRAGSLSCCDKVYNI